MTVAIWIFAGLNVLVWSMLLRMGQLLMRDSPARGVDHVLHQHQLNYYVNTPIVILACAIVLLVMARARKLRPLALTAEVALLLTVLPFLLLYMGGI